MNRHLNKPNRSIPYPAKARSSGNYNWKRPVAALLFMTALAAAAFLLSGSEAARAVQDLFLMQGLPQLTVDSGYGLIFAVGVLTSFHCVGMCGGIAVSQSLRDSRQQGEAVGPAIRYMPSIRYNAGRVVSYTIIGGVAGGLGQAIQLTGVWRGLVPLFGGVFMIIMGINLLGIWRALRRLNLRMPYFAARKLTSGASRMGPFTVGMLSGLMPCGPLQIIQLYALGTGSVLYGALSMLVFSMGTVPMLFLFAALNTMLSKRFTIIMTRVSAVIILILGGVMLDRGLALSGVSVRHHNVIAAGNAGVAVVQEDGTVQQVVTVLGKASYTPIIVQKGVPVRWTILAEEENLNSCNDEVVVPEFRVEKKLRAGNNVIEFTPMEKGDFIYTCWMGMIKSTIAVVEDVSRYKSAAAPVEAVWKKAEDDPASQELCMLPVLPDELMAAEAVPGTSSDGASITPVLSKQEPVSVPAVQFHASGSPEHVSVVQAPVRKSSEPESASMLPTAKQPASTAPAPPVETKLPESVSVAPASISERQASASAVSNSQSKESALPSEPSSAPSSLNKEAAASPQAEHQIQTVVTVVSPGSYTPVTVQKGVPVRWIIRAEEKDLYDCNNAIVAAAFQVEKTLTAGDNTVEFTPSETGVFPFTCWMEMIESTITVVEKL
jgi:sulfite exporter TauE/SafE/plastocyanin domain-containing protein